MIIGIDASRANKKEKTGVEWYAWHMIESLKKIISEDHRAASGEPRTDVRVILYSDAPLAGALATLPKYWESRVLYWPPKRLWTQVRLSWEMLQEMPDVLFVPSHAPPIIHPKKTVMMVHDVAAMRFPQSYSWFEARFSLLTAQYAAATLWKVITPSEFTKEELLQLARTDKRGPTGITVVHHGVDTRYRKIDDARAIDAVLKKYNITKPFMLSVGRLETKKNTANLVRAFDRVREHQPLQLVLVGNPGVGFEQVKQAIAESPWKYDIRKLGWVDLEDTVYLMNAARVLAYPSLYEGFGMVLLEAFACGTPVVAGSGSCLEEVAGDAAVFVEPGNVDNIAVSIQNLLADSVLRTEKINKGFARAKEFSWDTAATKTKAVLLS